jgi:hypothetical protein
VISHKKRSNLDYDSERRSAGRQAVRGRLEAGELAKHALAATLLSGRLRPFRLAAMSPDIATRVYNHTFRIDPIVRTLLDTDFYKLLMLQMIWKLHGERRVTFELINRTGAVRIADTIEERELTDQLDHSSGLPATASTEPSRFSNRPSSNGSRAFACPITN